MTVYEFCEYALDETEVMQLYSFANEKTVFEGSFAEAAESEFADIDVASFDVEHGKLVINLADEE